MTVLYVSFFEVESTDLNNNNYGFLHNIHDLFLKGFLFSYFFSHLGLHPTLRGIPILLQTFLPSLKVFSSFFFF